MKYEVHSIPFGYSCIIHLILTNTWHLIIAITLISQNNTLWCNVSSEPSNISERERDRQREKETDGQRNIHRQRQIKRIIFCKEHIYSNQSVKIRQQKDI